MYLPQGTGVYLPMEGTCPGTPPPPPPPPVNRMTDRCKKNCPKLRLRVVNMLIFCSTTCTAPAKFPSKRRFDSLVKITPGIVIHPQINKFQKVLKKRMHSRRMRTARSSSRRGGGVSTPQPPPPQIPLNFPLGCGPGPDPPELPPWVWA